MGFLSSLLGGGEKTNTGYSQEMIDKSLALQKQIYEEGLQRMQPYYDTGVSANAKLADFLGLKGGSNKSREQIYNQMLPQYTQTPQATSNQYIDPNTGQVVTIADPSKFVQQQIASYGDSPSNPYAAFAGGAKDPKEMLAFAGYKPYGAQPSSTTDYAALNAAVDAQMAGQGTPDYYGSLLDPFTSEDFQYSPSYSFNMAEGEKALARAQAARGNYRSPAALKDLLDYSQGLASNEWSNAYNMDAANKDRIYNMLMGVSGQGMGAAGAQTSSGMNYADAATGLYSQSSQLDLARQQANNQRRQSAFGNLMNIGGSAIAMFSDERLKENIEFIDIKNGHKIYEFDYKDGSGRYRGVMAQDVLKTEPDAVTEMPNGYLAVNYDMLGLKMERV